MVQVGQIVGRHGCLGLLRIEYLPTKPGPNGLGPGIVKCSGCGAVTALGLPEEYVAAHEVTEDPGLRVIEGGRA